MFQNATVSSRSSSSRSGHSCSRNSSMPSLRMRSPLSPKTSYNPLYRHSDALTSFDASHFVFRDQKQSRATTDHHPPIPAFHPNPPRNPRRNVILRRYNSHDPSIASTDDTPPINNNNNNNSYHHHQPGEDSTSSSMNKSRTGTGSSTNYTTASSSTTPGTSPDSTGLRSSNEHSNTGGSSSSAGGKVGRSGGQHLEARDFLERYSLPRVVRVGDGEPLLLYRCFESFTKVMARGVSVRKGGREKMDEAHVLHFPEGYCGWFSLLNEKGDKSAITHTTILQLVREQVCSFLSMQTFTAYAGHSPDPTDTANKVQYLKTQVKPGQLFQLRAVFQHRDMDGKNTTSSNPTTAINYSHSKSSTRITRSTRDKDLANRYAQLISQTNQEFYVPLTTKGEFYEIHSSIKAKLCFPGLLDKTGPLALDKDCLYKITHLLRRVALPIRVKLVSGPLPTGLPKEFPDTFILEKKFQEPLMVTCTLPAPTEAIQHQISCINLNSGLRLSRCMLGFDSENRLFKSQRLQAALAFCHKNVESWYREVRLAAPNLSNPTETACPECHKLSRHCEKCTRRQVGDLLDDQQQQLIGKEVLEKFPKPKKWYKHFKILSSGSGNDASDKFNKDGTLDSSEKVKSIDRYKDMSKLIEEKFGGKKCYNPVKKSASFMFSNKRIDLQETPTQTKNNPALLKCQSLDTQLYSIDEHQSQNTRQPWRNSKSSNISDGSCNTEFQNCILENETGLIREPKTKLSLKELRDLHQDTSTKIDLDEIKPVEDKPKLKPDLIPTTLVKEDHSYITDRLCSEFHVKTRVQKRSLSKHSLLTANFEKTRCSVRSHNLENTNQNLSIFDVVVEDSPRKIEENVSRTKSVVVVQVHEDTVLKAKSRLKKKLLEEDIPYGKVADEVSTKPSGGRRTTGGADENIYAEICEERCGHCETSVAACKCKKTGVRTAEYCYVKLGSNGDSVTQSDSDEAIYNTLR